jgi:Sec-independent protein translocase protein TatA
MVKVSRGKNWKKILGLIGAILVVGALALLVLEKSKTTDLVKMPGKQTTSGPTKEETTEQKQTESQAKQDFLDKSSQATTTESTTQDQPTATPTGSLELSASQNDQSVTVLTKMQNVAGGTCKLTVSNGAKITSQTAQIIYQPEFSSCAGFSLPTNSVGTGTWSINVDATPTNGSTMQKTITLEVK